MSSTARVGIVTTLMSFSVSVTDFARRYGLYFALAGLVLLFILYTYDLTDNPPGFYVDESAFAYNAYSIAKTGAS